jgi:hypothetical protein
LEEHYHSASPLNQDVLRISFTTHDVWIRGRSLRVLLNAVRKRSIDWIKPLPRRYEKLVATDAGFVGKIDVEELRDTAVSWRAKKCYNKVLQSDILCFDEIAQIPLVEGGEVVRDRGFEPLTPTVSR